MKPKELQMQIQSMERNGYKVLFEVKTDGEQIQTYMVNTEAGGRGSTAMVTTGEVNGKLAGIVTIIPIHTVKRFADEAIKMYDDDLTARLCAR